MSLWLLLCLWMWDIFFGEFQCLPVDDCSAVNCDSGALARESEQTSFYSAVLNQSPNVLLKACVSLLIFCLDDLPIDVSEVLKSPTIIVLLSISPFMSVQSCLIY